MSWQISSFEIIVGGANNQLATPEVAEMLAAVGTLYIPDFLANAGGIINIAEEANGYDQARAYEAVGRIRETTTAVLGRAEARGITPVAAAEELVAERLDGARDRHDALRSEARECLRPTFGPPACSCTRSMSQRESASSLGVPAPDDSWASDFPFEGDVGAVGGFLRATAASGEQRPFGFYRITRLADGRAIGGIGFKGQPVGGCVEIGYGLAPSARGDGYAAEAVVALLALAAEHGLSRVIADTTLDNIASQRTLIRAGFRLVGADDEGYRGDQYDVLLDYEALLDRGRRPA